MNSRRRARAHTDTKCRKKIQSSEWKRMLVYLAQVIVAFSCLPYRFRFMLHLIFFIVSTVISFPNENERNAARKERERRRRERKKTFPLFNCTVFVMMSYK